MNDLLSTTFAALADPTRRDILAQLAGGEKSVNELAQPFDLSLPAVSKHLKVLEHAGLVGRGRDRQRRPATLRPEGLAPVDEWLSRARAEWTGRLDRLVAHLATDYAGALPA